MRESIHDLSMFDRTTARVLKLATLGFYVEENCFECRYSTIKEQSKNIPTEPTLRADRKKEKQLWKTLEASPATESGLSGGLLEFAWNFFEKEIVVL